MTRMPKQSVEYPPHGRQGFANAEDAIADARSEIQVNDSMKFAVMRKGDNYGWLWPIFYAKRIAKSNGVEIVSIEDLREKNNG